MADKSKLTDKQKQFIKHYIVNGFNATQAAISAGYSKKTARQAGTENLSKPYIQKSIAAEFKDDKYIIQLALRELTKIISSDFTDFTEIDDLTGVITVKPLSEIPEGMTTVIKKIKQNRIIKQVHGKNKTEDIVLDDRVEYELPDKLKAIEIILKMGGKFTDKIDVVIESGLESKLKNIFNKHGEGKIDEFFELLKD